MSDTLVDLAKAFAKHHHQGQNQGLYSDRTPRPHYNHLADTVQVLYSHDFAEAHVVAAAWLHDVLEDTAVTEQNLLAAFPYPVVRLVIAVTDEPGQNRKEKKAATYPKIFNAGPTAIAIKLADRIANVSFSIEEQNGRFKKMYLKEYPEFRAALYMDKHIRLLKLWETLDKLMAELA